MQIDFEPMFRQGENSKQVFRMIQQALRPMTEDQNEACEALKARHEASADEFCNFESEIAIFSELTNAYIDGEATFVSTMCQMAHKFQSIFILTLSHL